MIEHPLSVGTAEGDPEHEMIVLDIPGCRRDQGEIGVVGLRLLDEKPSLLARDRGYRTILDRRGAVAIALEHCIDVELSHAASVPLAAYSPLASTSYVLRIT